MSQVHTWVVSSEIKKHRIPNFHFLLLIGSPFPHPFSSGGCVDPSFWPIHPHIERLYQFRVLKGPGFSTDPSVKWPGQRTCFGARSNDFDPDHLCYKVRGEGGQ